jgi:hypothetical protein
LALVSLYNTTNGPSWTTQSNWLTGLVSEWSGVTVTGQSITAIDLSANNLAGKIGDELVDILSLQSLNLSNNKISFIPPFTENPEITSLNVSGNNLEFGALEANAGLLSPEIAFTYSNQADLGTPLDTLINVGSPFHAIALTEGENNTYQWKRNDVDVPGATAKEYDITALGRSNMGEYVGVVNNSLFPGLTLKTAKQKALAVAKLSGKLFAHDGDAASKGQMTLFKINSAGKYDTTAVQNINPDGSYSFEKIVVDDYQLLGFADTLTYANALPTYYDKNSIYWEEATTMEVNSDLTDLNITSAYVPADVEKGAGLISGTFEEDVPTAKIERPQRVSGAGSSVRRVESSTRPEAEKLTLVAYVFTNDNGEFVMPELPKGNYRLNIQYPGYPMDESSFITITVGDGLESQIRVAAAVVDNKIHVDKVAITGLWEQTGYVAKAYPNPSTSFVHLDFETESATRTIQITDNLGREILKTEAQSKNVTLDVSHFSSGIYFLSVAEKNTKVKAIKVEIERN